MKPQGERKCPQCGHFYALADDGRFPSHRRSKSITAHDQRHCPGSRRTPEEARAYVPQPAKTVIMRGES